MVVLATMVCLAGSLGCERIRARVPARFARGPQVARDSLASLSEKVRDIGEGATRRKENASGVFAGVQQKVEGTFELVSSRIPVRVPSHEKAWRADLTVLPYAVFNGNAIELKNVRNCRYRSETDYDVRHYDLRFELHEIRSVDFIVVPFNNAPILAHTMLSFGLVNGRHFVVSVEARLEADESYSATFGSTAAYELMYVVADEQDVLPLRTRVRDSDVYLYAGNATPDQAQDLLVDVLQRVNQLSREPEFYDTLRNNCTTNLVDHVNALRPGKVPFDLRVVLPGHSDSLAYKLGLLQSDYATFDELKARSKINTLVELYEGDARFSEKIRQP
jgi:hypothetical protein